METMLDYIHEEEQVLTKILDEFTCPLVVNSLKQGIILATGSSYNAALAAKIYLEEMTGATFEIKEPNYFTHYEAINVAVDLVIAVSQSGKSYSTIEAIKKAKLLAKCPVLGITANPNSQMKDYVDELLDLNMGIETVGFVTKGYSATVLNLMLLALELGKQQGQITEGQIKEAYEELRAVIRQIPLVIHKSQHFFKEQQELFKLAQRFVAIGYGPNWGTVKEFETKFTETVRCPSQGQELEAYMHGPYLEANSGHLLCFLEADERHALRSQSLKKYMEPYVGSCIKITTGKSADKKTLALETNSSERVSPLLLVVPIQVWAYQVATAKGIDLSVRIFDDFDEKLKSKI